MCIIIIPIDVHYYYTHFEMTGDPNLIGSQQCDLFTNVLNRVIHVLNRIFSVLNRTFFALYHIISVSNVK